MSQIPVGRTLRVAGVPEHFNLPWTEAAKLGEFSRSNVDLRWTSMPGGTGAMVQSVMSGEVDVAVALTEGIIAAIQSNRNVPMQYLGGYVASPLRWMIATGPGREFNSIADLSNAASRGRTIRVSVSRLGSGSHLMAYLLAMQSNWPIDKLHFVVNKDFRSMRNAVQPVLAGSGPADTAPREDAAAPAPQQSTQDGQPPADIFMWEWFMTKPYVDSGELQVVGYLDSPWPCFGLVARQEWLEQPGHRQLVADAFRVVAVAAARFVAQEDSSCEAIAAHFGLALDDAHSWIRTVRYSRELVASLPALRAVLDMLVACGVLPERTGGQGQGAGADTATPNEHGYPIFPMIDTALARVLDGADTDDLLLHLSVGCGGEQQGMDDSSASPRKHDAELYQPMLPGMQRGIGAAHAAAVSSESPGWQRPRARSEGGANVPSIGPALGMSPPRARSPTSGRWVMKGAGVDALPSGANAEAYIEWRKQKAGALSAVVSHLQAFGGVDTTGAPQPEAPAIPAPEAVHLMQRSARNEVQGIGQRVPTTATEPLRDVPHPNQLHGVLVDIG